MKLILASQSPRRRELLKSVGYTFDIIPAKKDEIFDPALNIDDALQKVAYSKAREILDDHPDDVVIAADTIVCLDGEILGKPKDLDEARKTLASFSGRSHQVKTGVVVLSRTHRLQLTETTNVWFKDLSQEQIEEYVQKKTCLDKAGSYGIQETDFVSHTEGSYTNVVGLPITKTDLMLKLIQADPDIRF